MKIFLLLFLISLNVYAGGGTFPKGPVVKMLKDTLEGKTTQTRIITGDSDDPTAVAKSGDIGSIYIRATSGGLYQKQDGGSSTNWLPLLIGPSGSGTDECVARWDGTGVPTLQDSIFCITDVGYGTGLTGLDIDSLTFNGNTVSSTAGSLILDSFDGNINLPDLTASLPVKTDAAKNLISLAIALDSIDTSGILPIAKGGTASGAALTSDLIARSNGTSIIESSVTLNATGDIGAVTKLDVDNITIDGNTISSIGDLNLTPVTSTDDVLIPIQTLGTPTYTTYKNLLDVTGSTGAIADVSITSNGDGTIAVGAIDGRIRATDSQLVELLSFSVGAVASLVVTDLAISWIYVEYNAGSPQIVADVTERTDYNTNVLLGKVYREGITIHENDKEHIHITDIASLLNQRLLKTEPYEHESGSITSEVGVRNIAITAGKFWHGLDPFTTPAYDTSAASTFFYYYRTGAVWTEVASQTQIDNLQYNDTVTGLQTLSNNKYGVHWVYNTANGHIAVVYGQGDYTLLQAQNAEPDGLPLMVQVHGFLISKVIIQKSAATFTSIESAFDTLFTSTGVNDHNLLSNLQGGAATEYYHLDATEFGFLDGQDQSVLTTSSPTFAGLDVDNLNLNGNTLSSTDVNGNIIADANGTGQFNVLDYFLMPHLADPAGDPAAANSNLFFMDDELLHDKDENGVVNPVDNRNSPDVLDNRSFEKSYGTLVTETALGWLYAPSGSDAPTVETTDCVEGKGDQCLSITPFSETFTLDGTAFTCDAYDGKLVGFSAWIKAEVDVELCSLRAGVVQECIDYTADTGYKKLQANMYANSGDTCNVRLRSTTLVTGEVFLDGVKFEDDPIQFANQIVESGVRVHTSNGYGSTATDIRRFTTQEYSFGPDIAYVDSATNGASWTVARAGLYNISYSDSFSTGDNMGISKNASSLTTAIHTLALDEMLCISGTSSSGSPETCAGTFKLEAGDIIRAHTNAQGINPTTYQSFTITAAIVEEVMATSASSGLTDWVAYTPTFQAVGTPTNVDFYWKQVGDSYHITGSYTSGTSTGVELQIGLPNSGAVKAGMLITAVGSIDQDRALSDGMHVTVTGGDTYLNVTYLATGGGLVPKNGNTIAASGTTTSFTAIVPIEGLSSVATFPVNIPFGKPCLIQDVQTGGTNGANATANTIHTLTLNTLGAHCGFASLSANQMTLIPGEYKVCGRYSANEISRHRGYFYGAGASGYGNGGVNTTINFAGGDTNQSAFCRVFEISVAEAFELRVWVQDTKTNGFGFAMDFASGGGSSNLPTGDNEIYAEVEITMIKGVN